MNSIKNLLEKDNDYLTLIHPNYKPEIKSIKLNSSICKENSKLKAESTFLTCPSLTQLIITNFYQPAKLNNNRSLDRQMTKFIGLNSLKLKSIKSEKSCDIRKY